MPGNNGAIVAHSETLGKAGEVYRRFWKRIGIGRNQLQRGQLVEAHAQHDQLVHQRDELRTNTFDQFRWLLLTMSTMAAQTALLFLSQKAAWMQPTLNS